MSETVDGSAYSAARAEFLGLGLAFATKPAYLPPRLPDDLGEQSDDELMILFNQLTAWANYIAVQVTKSEVEEADAEAALKTAEAKYVVLNVKDDGSGIQRVRAERESDPEVMELAEKMRTRKALRKMIATMFSNTERDVFMVSRELTRRVGLAGPAGRSNWTGR